MQSQSVDDVLYLPTPERMVREGIQSTAIVPLNVCFMDLRQLDKFMKQLNEVRVCATPGCNGKLTPVHVKSAGLGGAVSITYNCTECIGQMAVFETSSKYELGNTTEVSIAVQVAFIIAGSTHMTYYKTLKHALGIKAVPWEYFQSTIKLLYPIVKAMVDRMCEDAKDDMRHMDQDELGSWSRAVTSADGTWMTRGFHSANFTFSIRNYFNGALLYRKHLCQRGRDDVVQEDLYQGTSKGAEGYAARLMFSKAKEEGMNVAIQWQDADSSSSKAVTDHFPDAEIMICGGHAGRAHKKQLEKLSKMKRFTENLITKHKAEFPSVADVVCHCSSRHKPGCGCLSDMFIARARNNFSLILSRSDTADHFSSKLKALVMHARDQHEWDEGKCDFHHLRVCSCKRKCDGEDLKCVGKEYHTKCTLTCPFHSLAYKIECHERAKMSKLLVHPILKRGHSNWLEASHNVFIRFRPKHINLERLHYVVSTELALLQSNMTYMYEKRGPQYHWVVELFKLLRLPVFDGVQAALEAFNKERKQELDRQKTERYKRRRVQLKEGRTMDAQRRKEWSKKHGHDTYGDDANEESTKVKSAGPRAHKKTKVSTEGKCRACGFTTHQRSTHRDCPFNKVCGTDDSSRLEDDQVSENSDVIGVSEDSLTDEEGFSLKEHAASSDSDWCFEDNILRHSECTCGAMSRAHKKDCPLSSRNRYVGCTLFAKAKSQTCKGAGLTVADVEKNSAQPSQLGKRERHPKKKPPTVSKRKSEGSSFQVGDYVSVHMESWGKFK